MTVCNQGPGFNSKPTTILRLFPNRRVHNGTRYQKGAPECFDVISRYPATVFYCNNFISKKPIKLINTLKVAERLSIVSLVI